MKKIFNINYASLIFTLIHVLILLACVVALTPITVSFTAFFSFLIKFVAAYLIVSDTIELYKFYSNYTSKKS